MIGMLEQKLEQQQQNLLLTSASTEQFEFLDGSLNLDANVDLDGSESLPSLLMLPTSKDDPTIPLELELPSTFSPPELLRSEL